MRKLMVYLLVILTVVSCRQNETAPLPWPTIDILSAYSVDESTANARGILFPDDNTAAEEFGIVWGQTSLPEVTDNKGSTRFRGDRGVFSVPMGNLELGQTYQVRAYFRIGNQITYSEPIRFTHQGPFVWKQLAGVNWSDRQHTVSSTVASGGVIVFRPVDQRNTERWWYIPRVDQWMKMDNFFIPFSRFEPLLFSLNKFGNEAVFFGGGYVINESLPRVYVYQHDFYQILISGNARFEDFPDFPFRNARLAHFVIDNRGYVLAMDGQGTFRELLNGMSWHQKSDFPGPFRGSYAAFSVGTRGYVVVESPPGEPQPLQVYEYDPETDSWERKADFPGESRINGVAFSLNGRGYYGCGQSNERISGLRDLWQYDPQTDSWEKYTDFPGTGNVQLIADAIGEKVYVGLGFGLLATATGAEQFLRAYDYWEFVPE
jgi:hypothetical protein